VGTKCKGLISSDALMRKKCKVPKEKVEMQRRAAEKQKRKKKSAEV